MTDDQLMDLIRTLRNEDGIPLHFRRIWSGDKVYWYIWYGYTQIAYWARTHEAHKVVCTAVIVHNEIYKDLKPIKTKAA